MIDKIIADLYKHSSTPKNIAYSYESSSYTDAVDALITCDLRSTQFPDFSDNQIKEFTIFCLQLIDAPADLRGFLRLENCIRHLLKTFLINASNVSIQNQFTALCDRWFYYLGISVPSELLRLNKRPIVKHSPLMFFHFAALNASILPDNTYPFYSAYAHRFHKAIRDFHRKHPSRGFYETAIRAARYFYVFMPAHILSLPQHPVNMPQQYINAFLGNIKKNIESGDIAKLMKFYKRVFQQLLKRTRIQRKKSAGKSRKRFGSSHPGNKATDIQNVLLQPATEEDIDFGVDDFVQHEPSEVVVLKKPYLNRSRLDSLNCRNHHLWWDVNCLKLDELHALYTSCVKSWNKSDLHDRIICFLLIHLHFGCDVIKLLQLSHGDNISLPRLQISNDNLFLILEPPIKRSDESYPGCLQPSKEVYLLMPDKLSRLVKSKLKPGPFFEVTTSDGRVETILLNHIVQFIDKLINLNHVFRITLSRLHSSFPVLYSGRFGLDPILGCYVSSTVIHHLYSSQLHYIFCNARGLSGEHLKVFKRLDSSIITAPHAQAERTQLRSEHPDNYHMFFSIDSTELPSQLPAMGYGSPKVPLTVNLQFYVDSIKTAIINTTNIIARHNLFVCYTFHCLQFATGMRPRNNSDEYVLHFLEDYNVVLLRDKQSPQFREERVVMLPELAISLLLQLKNGFQRLKTYIAANISSSILSASPEDLFFFISDNGIVVDFTLKDFHDILLNNNIPFDFPDNAARHYLKTHLHQAGESIDVSDAWCGHSHAGREVLNVASSVIPVETFSKCRNTINLMLVDLGFSDIPYLPEL